MAKKRWTRCWELGGRDKVGGKVGVGSNGPERGHYQPAVNEVSRHEQL